jgi:hypothetical protein
MAASTLDNTRAALRAANDALEAAHKTIIAADNALYADYKAVIALGNIAEAVRASLDARDAYDKALAVYKTSGVRPTRADFSKNN